MVGRPSHRSESGWKAVPEVWEWSAGLPEVREWWEALPEVREWSGVRSGSSGVVGRPSRRIRKPFRTTGSGREALPEVQACT